MWIWWTKINRNPNILGRLYVIKWRNWTWWESYLNTEISDETQIAIVVWPQWYWKTKYDTKQHINIFFIIIIYPINPL